MAELSTNVRYIKGIGETRAKALEKLGITTLRDLISYFPRSYEDRTLTRPIRDLTEGENVCVRAMIAADPTAHRIPGGRTIVRTRAVDETGVLDIVFFNQEYRKNSLHRGEIYIFYGKGAGQRRPQLPDAFTGKQAVIPLFKPVGGLPAELRFLSPQDTQTAEQQIQDLRTALCLPLLNLRQIGHGADSFAQRFLRPIRHLPPLTDENPLQSTIHDGSLLFQ